MQIKEFFEEYGRVVVALSGGVDSAVLLHMADKYPSFVKAVYVNSEFQPDFELRDAKRLCDCLNIKLDIINLSLLDDKQIASNPTDRCYYCKKALFTAVCEYAKRLGDCIIVDGTNASDDIKDRVGYKALQELGVFSPLRMCGFTKEDIRTYARRNSLDVWNKPSYACLATRIPFGTAITKDILSVTELAESKLFELGFKDFRLRYRDGNALLELSQNDRELYMSIKEDVDAFLLRYYKKVLLDKKGR